MSNCPENMLLTKKENNKKCINCYGCLRCNNCYGCNECYDCENVYFSYCCNNCYGCRGLFSCENCQDCNFLCKCKNCKNCEDCLFCIGLQNKRYCIGNKQYTRDEYTKIYNEIKHNAFSIKEAKKYFENDDEIQKILFYFYY